MDPDAALAIITDTDADDSDRSGAIEGLRDWICRGGFPPTMDVDKWVTLLDFIDSTIKE